MEPVTRARTYDPDTFGSASFLTRADAERFGITQRGAGGLLSPYVGGLIDDNKPGDFASLIYARAAVRVGLTEAPRLGEGSGHLLTVAPTRAGKGVGQIIPNLLQWEGSVLVLDVKGENYLRSAGCRQKALKQRVFRFAPFEAKSSVWNPLLSIRAVPGDAPSSPEEEEDTRYLTNLIFAPTGSANDVFWENSAKNFIEGLLLYVRTEQLASTEQAMSPLPEHRCMVRERSMAEVRRLLTLGDDDFASLLVAMGLSRRMLVSQAGLILQRLSAGAEKAATSILAVALEQTSVWGYSRLRQVTHRSGEDGEPVANSFAFKDLREGQTSIYLIIPPDYLTEYRSVLRVLIGIAMRELRMSYGASDQEKPPVLFLLDEFPQLAYMRPIEEALLYLAGYNVRFWFFVQDISQLQLHYPNSWRTFLANTSTQCFFGVSDIQTANLVSEMAGTTTVTNLSFGASATFTDGVSGSRSRTRGTSSGSGPGGASSGTSESESYTSGWSYSASLGQSTNTSFVARRLIMPDEVLRMHDYEQVVFMKGIAPLRATRIPWFKNTRLEELGKIPSPEPVDFR